MKINITVACVLTSDTKTFSLTALKLRPVKACSIFSFKSHPHCRRLVNHYRFGKIEELILFLIPTCSASFV